MGLSTSSAMIFSTFVICAQLWGWEKRLSKQLYHLLRPEEAAQDAREARALKEYDRLRLFLGIFPRGAAAQAKADLYLKNHWPKAPYDGGSADD
jgi:hypothetical protein